MRRIGIDVGSTTAKVVVLDDKHQTLYSAYKRHNARVYEVLQETIQEVQQALGNEECTVAITGSAGLGLAEKLKFPFVQEVVASAETVRVLYPHVSTLVDIGGEDSKIIFFDKNKRADIRMNGNCAGGTGAFIDQMASLLNVPVEKLNDLAANHKRIFPIASRCGVFAKTDVQNLLSRRVPSSDIVASVFNAVAVQVLNTLARGSDIHPKILFCGGPFSFIPMLRTIFQNRLNIGAQDVIIPANPELLPAIGTALYRTEDELFLTPQDLVALLKNNSTISIGREKREPKLFENEQDFAQWKEQRFTKVDRIAMQDLHNKKLFLGIDSGSTTSKLILCDENGKVALDFYVDNRGNHVDAVQEGLRYFQGQFFQAGVTPIISGSAVTGYGEDLIKAVFDIDFGIVETIAHFRAASFFTPDVSFILDIGGQDMKAMFIDNGTIRDIQINEACSSGCGSFIQTFAQTLGFGLAEFAETACLSDNPCSLGSRCTVFMNSKVKQFLREGATPGDISAGLAYSVMRNCINKVLKISDMSLLGDHIVVQGGTFQNPAVHRAFEQLSGKPILCPDISGHMGAYGAALYARDYVATHQNFESCFGELSKVDDDYLEPKVLEIQCKGCENVCTVNKLTFEKDKIFYTGNKCEKIFSNKGDATRKGISITDITLRLLFDRSTKAVGKSKGSLGIPRVLNMFENFPFWNTLLTQCGFDVQLSDPSTNAMFETGSGTVMSDNICYPAKLVHGHILNLGEKPVDRIFYPTVVYEDHEACSHNAFNCPIVSGYPEVINSSINPEKRFGIPLDKPVINFKDLQMLQKGCWAYLKQFKVRKAVFIKAFEKALQEKRVYRDNLRKRAQEIVAIAQKENRPVIMLSGRPYHTDPQINHRIPEIITALGLDVITADSVPAPEDLKDIQVLTWWTYSNRLYAAAKFVAEHANVEIVQLNSFGCGPDSIAIDEMRTHLRHVNKNLTSVKIDDIASPGSVKLRIRTLVESLKIRGDQFNDRNDRIKLPIFEKEDAHKKIIVPYFSRFHSPFIDVMFRKMGYDLEVLPPTDYEAQDLGLKFTNNEICYPAILVVGDIIKALQSGKYDLTNIAVGITQTGGQCRASNYLSLLKKALINAGFESIPLVSINAGKGSLHEQPGFTPNTKELIMNWLYGIMMGDIISQMYYSTVVREKHAGDTEAVANYYMRMARKVVPRTKPRQLVNMVKRMVKAFNAIPVHKGDYPQIGVVGEIYAKYSEFANHDVVRWMSEHGVEVIIPPMLEFFVQEFVNREINVKANLKKGDLWLLINLLLEARIKSFLGSINKAMQDFKYYRPFHDVRKLSKKAEQVLNLVNQYGEGWLLTSEFMAFAEEGIDHILCLQPFGCIANQVVAKGVERKMKDIHPNLNILFIDLDADTSAANYINRLHFLMKGAKDSLTQKIEVQSAS
jgi:predicted CoA-substrate-specific enzyme activase